MTVKNEQERRVPISVSLSVELWQRIDAVAQARRRNRSAVIAEILARHIDEQRPVA